MNRITLNIASQHTLLACLFLLRTGMCDSDPGPGLRPGCHPFTADSSNARWDILADDGYGGCAKAELYQADCGKEAAY